MDSKKNNGSVEIFEMKNACKLLLLFFFCFTSSLMASYESSVSSDSPIAWWRFDDTISVDGTIARDRLRNIQQSVFEEDVSIVSAGIDEKAAWFNGNQAGVDLGTGIRDLLDDANAITVEAWIRCANLPNSSSLFRPIFCSRINDAQAGMKFW